jgi:F-type H+-transporting ATPase subunit b
MEFLKEAEVWVGVGLVLFFVILAVLRVPAQAARALDAKSDEIRTALEEAQRLRDEARAVLEDLKARRVAMEADAKRMLADAEADARRLEADAKVKLEAQIVRRTELADRRIAMAESQARAEVKAAAADLAAQTAERVLAAQLKGKKTDPLVDRAVGELAQRLQ